MTNNSIKIRSASRSYNHVGNGKAEAIVLGEYSRGVSLIDNADAMSKIVKLDKAIHQAEKIKDSESAELLRLSQAGLAWKVSSFSVTYLIWIMVLFGAPQVVISVATFISLVFFLRALYFFVQPALKELQMAKDFHKEVVNTQKEISNSNFPTELRANRAKEMIDQLLGKKQSSGKKSILKIQSWIKDENREKIYQAHLNRRISTKGVYYIKNNKAQLERLSQILKEGSDQEKLDAIGLTETFLEKTSKQIEVKQTELKVQIYVIYGLILVGLILSIASVFIPGTDQFASKRFAMSVATNSVFVTMHALSILKGYKTKEKAARYQIMQGNDTDIIEMEPGDLNPLIDLQLNIEFGENAS